MVLGITGLCFFWTGPFGWVQSVLAIVFSAIGLGHAKQAAPHGTMALVGVILGALGILIIPLL
ncbi:MAG: DUF4190 domain-containing protein, partial [Acidimicrobiales bacterium]